MAAYAEMELLLRREGEAALAAAGADAAQLGSVILEHAGMHRHARAAGNVVNCHKLYAGHLDHFFKALAAL